MPRKWMPSEYMDEVAPPPRATPSHWIMTAPGDVYALVEVADCCGDVVGKILKPGDVVDFYWTEKYNSITINIAEDGTYTSIDTPDPRANLVWILGDPGSLDESVESFARNWVDNGEYPETVELEQFAWSDKSYPYRFEIDPVAGPRFVAVEG